VQKGNSPSENANDEEVKEGNCWSRLKGKEASGYLVFVSELIHNFFDGFAIGVGFASKERSQFIPIVVAVFAHEIPSEMGNVGILLKSKFSNCQTILCNAFINSTALIGVVLGLGLGQIGEAVQIYVITIVAGNFIYIGADIWRNLMKKSNAWLNLLEFLSFCLGVGAMYLVLLAESDDEHGH
jgi:zinc and cadmium transporter